MGNVKVTKSINVPAQAAWNNLSKFTGIENYSPIASSVVEGEGEGAARTCTMPDGAQINETLNKVDHENMHMEYAIVSGPFPVTDYLSTIDVRSKGESSCEITWGCTYNSSEEVEADMNGLFEGFYNVIIESLGEYINQPQTA